MDDDYSGDEDSKASDIDYELEVDSENHSADIYNDDAETREAQQYTEHRITVSGYLEWAVEVVSSSTP